MAAYQSFISSRGQWRPLRSTSKKTARGDGRGEKLLFKGLFHLGANLAYTVLSDLILQHTSRAIREGPARDSSTCP